MSAGGKAGLAIGIILILGVALSLVFYFYKKKRDAASRERLEDEKNDFFAASSAAQRQASTRTASTAPRLSLRPVTEFIPNFGEKNQNRGNALPMTNGPFANPAQARNLTPQSTGTRPAGGQEQNKNNPFGHHAETIDNTNANGPAIVKMTPEGEILTGVAVTGAAAAAGTSLARGASKRGNGSKPLDFTKPTVALRGPPSPAGTEFSMSSEAGIPTQQSQSAAAIAAAGGPANSSVHRVQLDFNPSMEDELELRAGQLIRLLHEYDDGWVSCIRKFSTWLN